MERYGLIRFELLHFEHGPNRQIATRVTFSGFELKMTFNKKAPLVGGPCPRAVEIRRPCRDPFFCLSFPRQSAFAFALAVDRPCRCLCS
jgi:hypothetical protein